MGTKHKQKEVVAAHIYY